MALTLAEQSAAVSLLQRWLDADKPPPSEVAAQLITDTELFLFPFEHSYESPKVEPVGNILNLLKGYCSGPTD